MATETQIKEILTAHFWTGLPGERTAIEEATKQLARLPNHPDGEELMQFDLTADKHWNEGCDFALGQLCKWLGVDPADVLWDAATETVEGDVMAVIGNIMCAKYGDDFAPQLAVFTARVSTAAK